VPPHSFGWKTWQVLKTVQARLRFIALLAVIGLVIGNWTTINNYWEKWTRSADAGTASSDDEWFCPMHPQIVRDSPKEKCPICHMDLAKRKKGSGKPEPLPPGVVNRVQLSPYRVVLAGVRTWEVQRLPLVKEITTYGSVEFNETKQAHIAATQKGRILKLYVNYTGQTVREGEKLALLDVRYSPELTVTLQDLIRAQKRGDREGEQMARRRLRIWDISDSQLGEMIRDYRKTGKFNTRLTIYSPLAGHVIRKFPREGSFVEEGSPLFDVDNLETVWIEAQVYEADQALLRKGQPVTATVVGLPDQEFKGTLDFVYPHLDESSRTLTVRFHLPNKGHKLRPGMYATVTMKVSPQKMASYSKTLAEDAVSHQGQVLAVPDSAVIDTGKLKIVYREASPDVFEGMAVRLGPRMAVAEDPTAYYPVLEGLQEGDRVVTNGSFLIDAETRLNAAAGSIYFGGSGGKAGPSAVTVRPSSPLDEDAQEKKVKAELAKLGTEDRRLAQAQKFCPVLTGNRLGSMGPPVKISVGGKPVFLCCGSCEAKAKADPAKTLKTVEGLKKKARSAPPPAPQPSPKPDPEVKANLAKLGAADRPLAEAQKFCPETGKLLGSMGKPVKEMIQGKPVFLCCEGCRSGALKNPKKTLEKVEQLKAKARAAHSGK
jgi:multidrug efflux pump subunit AcrA (membrane-fusion protein)